MNASPLYGILTQDVRFAGVTHPAGTIGVVHSSVCSLDTGEAEHHFVTFPGHGAIPIPAYSVRLLDAPGSVITPEHRISYAIAALTKLVDDPSGVASGHPRGRCSPSPVKDAVRDLDLMWVKYLEGNLPHLVDGVEVPF